MTGKIRNQILENDRSFSRPYRCLGRNSLSQMTFPCKECFREFRALGEDESAEIIQHLCSKFK